MTCTFHRSLPLLAFVLLVALPASGQVPTGTQPFGSFGGGPDIINLANLNSHIAVPVLHKAGRSGFNFTYDLSYDTSVWTTVTSGSTTTWQPVLNWGWRGVTEVATGYMSRKTLILRTCRDRSGNVTGEEILYYNWVFHDPFGTSIAYPGDESIFASGDCGTPSNFSDISFGYTLTTTNGAAFTMHDAAGKFLNVPVNSGTGAGTATDRNGNEISVSTTGVFTDTLGTTALTVAGSGTPSSPRTFTYTAPSGASAAYTMSFKTDTVKTNYACSGINEYPATSNSLVDRITLPDGTFYQFNYEATPGFSGDVTGRLKSVTVPTGGTITYTYTGGSTGHITCADGSASGYTRQTPDGTWTYGRAASTTTITDPQGNQTVIQFQGIYETQRKVYQGSTSGTLLRTINTCYNGAASPCTGTAVALPITQRTVLDQIGSSGPQCQHVYKYSTFSVLTEQDDYDYATPGPGPLLRKVLITIASLGNINAFQQQVTVQNGSLTTVAQSTFNYDESTPTATSGTPQHLAISGSRGNPTTVTQLVRTGVTLTSHSTYYDTGTVNTSTDANGAVTTFHYASGTASCGNSFPTSVTEPLSMSRSFAWSCPGGVQTSVTDENIKTTSVTWNDTHFWRPAATNFPDGGQTSITYNSATSVTSTTKMNSSQNIVGTVLLDTLGRKKQSQLADPQGMDFVDTTYDALGRVATVTNPHRSTASTTDGTTTYAYDALSRPTSVTLQDGSKSMISYSNNTVTATDPAGKSRKSVYDSLGHITQLFEDPATLNYETDYTYDALGDLLTVSQKGGSSSSANWRTRTFVYDGLSRLTSESTQEAGNITYGYDASGHAGDLTSRVAPAPNQTNSSVTVTTTYAYDALHRLTQKSYNDGTTPAANFFYDANPGPGGPYANVIGRLTEAYTGTSTNVVAASTFSYDPMGRVTLSDQRPPMAVAAGTNYAENFAYDLAGNMTSYTDAVGIAFTQAFDSAGRVAGVTSSISDVNHPATLATVDSSVGYYPPGALRKITYGNGLTGTAAIEARLQPCRINLNSAGSAITDGCADGAVSGTIQDFFYAYGASGSTNNGNVTIMNAGGLQNFNRTFTFDSLNRLATMSDAHTSNSCLGLQWTYDPWGNRTAQSVTAGTCGTFSAAINTRNQLIGPPYTYDAAGNLTADGSHTYTYDAENRLISVDGGSTSTYIYNGLGQRAEKITGSTKTDYLYDASGNVLNEYTNTCGSPCVAVDYFYLGGQLIGQYKAGTTYFLHGDHLGSTRLVTGLNQSVMQNLDYLPFGEINSTDSGTTTHKFTGDERDSETSLDHTQFRQYTSQLARWITPDPLGGDIGNPQSLNRYSYVLNDPLNLIDPFGLDCVDVVNPDGSIFTTCTVTPGDDGGTPTRGQCFDIVQDGVLVGNTCDGSSGGHETRRSGGGGGGRGGGRGTSGRVQCAVKFGQNHSLAAGLGAIFGNNVGNNFVTQLFLGNTVSSLAKIGTDIFGNSTPTGSQVASMAIKGAGQGIPGLPPTFNPVVGPARDAAVGAAVSAGYNVVAGVGQQTLELGIGASGNVASTVAPLASTTLQGIASTVAIAKFGFDVATFIYGATVACHQ